MRAAVFLVAVLAAVPTLAHAQVYPLDWTKADRKQAAAVAELQRQQDTQRTSRTAEDYPSQLQKKYSSRLTFSTSRAAEIVGAFDIDCRSRDHRYLPLINVLYARLAAMDSDKVWVTTNVDNRGDEVRIVDTYMGKNGQLVPPQIAFVITKWDELQPLEMTTEALMNLCYGSYGPIWVVPTE